MKKIYIVAFFIASSLYSVLPAEAATLLQAKDTITTSRPSPSSPLSADAATGSQKLSIYNNGSRFLASDSAQIIRTSTATIIDSSIIIASQSSLLTDVFFSENLESNLLKNTDILFVPIISIHTIQFKNPTTIPNGGDILISFPILGAKDANNEASPSATTFQLNNLDSNTSLIKVLDDNTDITANVSISVSNPIPGTSPRINVTIASGTIASGSIVKIYIPRVINPTKKKLEGSADRWNITIQTRDSSDVEIDRAVVRVATVEGVKVTASVESTFTFTIGGILNGEAINKENSVGCTSIETTNTGADSTATIVDLGTLSNTPSSINTKISNIAAQLLSVRTNASGGYVITATSGGSLKNETPNFAILSSSTPKEFPNGKQWFGIHPCGLDVDQAAWTTTSSQSCNTFIEGSQGNICKYGWPDATPRVISQDSTGPIGNSPPGNGLVSVAYASGVENSVPAGTYKSAITYVATTTF